MITKPEFAFNKYNSVAASVNGKSFYTAATNKTRRVKIFPIDLNTFLSV